MRVGERLSDQEGLLGGRPTRKSTVDAPRPVGQAGNR
jgi:hypothetical protein